MADSTTVLLELCQRATNLANTNSTRTVEYLTASKSHQTHGFRELAINFLELCQTLWPIQSGLLDASRTEDQLPTDVAKELTAKVSQTIDDFNSFDSLLSRLLTYERKKGFSKFTKGLGLMNVETEIQKLSGSLARDRDTLRMGSLAFKWILGDANLPSAMGSAYTTLASALRTANGQKLPTSASQQQQHVNQQRQPSMKSATAGSQHSPSQQEIPKLGGPPAQLPPLPDWQDTVLEPNIFQQTAKPPHNVSKPLASPLETPSSTGITKRPRQFDLQTPSARNVLPQHASQRHTNSPAYDKRTTTTTLQELEDYSGESRRATLSDTASQTTVESMLQFEDMLKSYEYERKHISPKPYLPSKTYAPPKPHEYERASATSPVHTLPVRRNLKPLPGSNSPAVKAALITAVQQKNHQALEELLETHASSDLVAELNLLGQAILNADCGSIRLLLLSGAEPNRVDQSGVTPLFIATEMSLLEAASILLKYGADPNLPAGPLSESPLTMSVTGDKCDFLELYLQHAAADVNALLPDGDNLIIKAITATSSLDLVSVMLSSGVDPNKKTKYGKTPLLESLNVQRVDIANLLLDHGANPNLAGPKHPLWPAVHQPALIELLMTRGAKSKMAPGIMELATSINSIETVTILLNHKVDPNLKKDGVYTPLCSAIRDDRADIVTLLLSNGANPNVPASEYPCFKCVTHNRLHFLPELIAAGADLHTPKGILEVAVEHNNQEAILYLLSQGVDPNARNIEGNTALTTAIRNNRSDLVDILLSHNASPAVRGKGHDWPLTLAIHNPSILAKVLPAHPKGHSAGTKGIIEAAVVADQPESIRLLVAAGFSVEDKTGGVFSPLTSALRERYLEIVKLLLDEAGADINAPGEHLPIVKALRRCRGPQDTEAIEMLLERGADINLVYREWTGLMQAIENGEPEILQLMIEKSRYGVDLTTEVEGKTVIDYVRERDWEEGEAILLGKKPKA